MTDQTIQVKAKPVGRPPQKLEDILPADWKEQILEMCAQGYSDVEIRAALSMPGGKFSHNHWYALKDREPEFAETINKGKVLCEAWWTRQMRENITNPKFQTFAWFTNMKNRFSHNWRDKVDVEHTGNLTVSYGHRNAERTDSALRN